MINIAENSGEEERVLNFRVCRRTYKEGLHEITLTSVNQMGGRHFREGVGLTSFDVAVTAIAKKYATKTYP